ncbi:MAG TPA: hypothetical protein DEB39_07150, partial [Planctomycetaceae bacterium]|nr:hypothetical protein [Planctomycetaceae bacterium]
MSRQFGKRILLVLWFSFLAVLLVVGLWRLHGKRDRAAAPPGRSVGTASESRAPGKTDAPPVIDLGVLAPLVETDPSEKKPAGGNIPGEPLPGVPLPMEVVPDRTEKKSEEGDSEEEGSLLSRMTEEERAAAQKEVEREIAALRAAEDAQFAEETAAPPLVEEPEKLVALAPEMKLWVTPDSKSLVMIGVVTLREGPLELFCCRRNSKEYESIV